MGRVAWSRGWAIANMASGVAYELSCPSCSHMVSSPFVRVGAVVLCGKCGSKYRIADEHVRRSGGGGAKPAEAVVKAASEEGESSARQLSDGSMAGLSGLSALMEAEPDAPEPKEEYEPLPLATPIVPPSGLVKLNRRDSRRRPARLLYWIAGVLGLAMAGIGGALWWAVVSDSDVALPAPSASELPLSADEAAAIHNLPLINATLLREVRWEPVQPALFQAPSRIEGIALQDRARSLGADGREYYTATVTSDLPGIIMSATLRVALIDMSRRVVARGSLPIGFFGRGRQQPVRIAFPEGLATSLLSVEVWVEVTEHLPDATYLGSTDVRPASPGSLTVLRLKAANRERRAVSGTRALLRALDDKGDTIARYMVSVPWPIDPGSQLITRVELPPPGPDRAPASWVADVAGAPVR